MNSMRRNFIRSICSPTLCGMADTLSTYTTANDAFTSDQSNTSTIYEIGPIANDWYKSHENGSWKYDKSDWKYGVNSSHKNLSPYRVYKRRIKNKAAKKSQKKNRKS